MKSRISLLVIACAIFLPSCNAADKVAGPQSGLVDAASWISGAAAPIAASAMRDDMSDLEPLRAMVGSAHLIGLGEGTHGTREFFQLKHRIFAFLVKEMGFRYFGIEATSPEADDLNRYVEFGEGDPVRLLSRLYFWTWNTQEVLDLIRWMRQWNATAPAGQTVRFFGFDMQFPGASMDSVTAFIERYAPARSAEVNADFACIAPYRNFGLSFARSASSYSALPENDRNLCHSLLLRAHAMLAADSATYAALSSPGKVASVLHHARLVQQFEEAYSDGPSFGRKRDGFMAENAAWKRSQGGPDARLVLWAHNAHVTTRNGQMGGALRSAFGDDYLALGFLFGTGAFNAVAAPGSGYSGLGAWTASLLPGNSAEALFMRAGGERLLLDARRIPAGGPAAAGVGGPLLMRSIGATYDPRLEQSFFYGQAFPADFQLLLFVRTATASTLLPYAP